MGVFDIVDLLRERDEWMTTKEIAEALNCRTQTVTRSLRSLYKPDKGVILRQPREEVFCGPQCFRFKYKKESVQ